MATSCNKENDKVSGVEPAFGSSFAISAQATNENSNDDQDPVSVPTIQGCCESNTRLNPDLNLKAVLEVGCDLVTLEEILKKVVVPTETDNSRETSRMIDGKNA